MMRASSKGSQGAAFVPIRDSAAAVATAESGCPAEWEARPCGMLVQKRSSAAAVSVAPNIRVKVKYGSAYHEIYLSSLSTFGELKKRLSEKTGLHPEDQKLLFKGKERESGAFLDISGVKDGSKMALLEDLTAQAKRLLEQRRTSKMEKSSKSIASIGIEVDRLASQVSALEAIVSKGGKVAEGDVMKLTELLMMQLIKLDDMVVADGDAKLQRGMQLRRVQKYVETLDVLKIKNSIPKRNGQLQQQQQKPRGQLQQQQQHQTALVTTKWETFDALFSPSTSTTTSSSSATPSPRFDWELF